MRPEQTVRPPLLAMFQLGARAFKESASYVLLPVALAIAVGLVTLTAANRLPGVVAFGDARAVVVGAFGVIVIALVGAFFLEVIEDGPGAVVRTLAQRAEEGRDELGFCCWWFCPVRETARLAVLGARIVPSCTRTNHHNAILVNG
jgi:hypothetical protein